MSRPCLPRAGRDTKRAAMNGLHQFSLHAFNKHMRQPTLHPQIAVVDPARLSDGMPLCFSGNFYAVCFKHTRCGDKRYGRCCQDFQYGTLTFAAPGVPVTIAPEDAAADGISGLLFCPELFCLKSLAPKRADYTFFAYAENEALHLSLPEKQAVLDCMARLHAELQGDIGRYTLRFAAIWLELLLDRCRCYYERQFIVRSCINRQHLAALDTALDAYFSREGRKSEAESVALARKALPSLTPAYLDDLVRVETGKTLAEYVRVSMLGHIRLRLCSGGQPAALAEEFGLDDLRPLRLLCSRRPDCGGPQAVC